MNHSHFVIGFKAGGIVPIEFIPLMILFPYLENKRGVGKEGRLALAKRTANAASR